MNSSTKTPLAIAFAVVAVLFLLFGIGATTGTMMNAGWVGPAWMYGNGMMGNGMMGNTWRGGMGGISWMWIPALLTLGLGVVLGWAIFGKKS